MAVSAKITKIEKVLLKDLTLGKYQARVNDLMKNIDDLASSIEKIGLQQPIVICPSQEGVKEKYEILAGQRRFLAHKQLNIKEIYCSIYDGPLTELEAKVISLSENAVRNPMVDKDMIDACLFLYRRYGTIKDVAIETGLSQKLVSQYVKYESLHADVQKAVDDHVIKLDHAIKATRALEEVYGEGKAPPDEVIDEAKYLQPLTGAEVDKITRERKKDPSISVEEAHDRANKSEIHEFTISLSSTTAKNLSNYANEEGSSPTDAAANLIEDGLDRALLSEN